MCRVLGYLGPSVPLDDLVTHPANSLVNQSFDPEYHHLLQIAGTGFASWDVSSRHPDEPLIYKSHQPAFYDRNLRALCSKLSTTNLLAHVRATGYSDTASVNDDNCHPFLYPGFKLAMAHNGGLPGWRDMRQSIAGASRAEIVAQLRGSTDTETMYGLLMSQFADPTANMRPDEIIDGLRRFMRRIMDIKREHANVKPAKLKLFLADGNDLIVANLGLGSDLATDLERDWEELREYPHGSPEHALAGIAEPVWYLAGRSWGRQDDAFGMRMVSDDDMDAVVIASEHLTERRGDWHPVPFQHVVFFARSEGGCSVDVRRLDF